MQVGRITHLQHDVRRHGAHAVEDAARNGRLVAGYHDDGHRLADRAAHAQHDAGHDAGHRSGHDDAEHRALVIGAERQGPLVVFLGNGIKRALRHGDDGGQDHDAQQHGGRQKRETAPRHVVANERHHDHQAEEAVDDRRDARQKLHAGLEHRRHAPAGEPREEDGAQEPCGHAHDDGAGGHVDAAHDHREDAVDIVGGTPGGAEEEFRKAYLGDGRHAIREEEYADESYREDRNPRGSHEQRLRNAFLEMYVRHAGSLSVGSPGFTPERLPSSQSRRCRCPSPARRKARQRWRHCSR